MEMNSNPSVVFEGENDDDAFYADIRRQILLLTSEDNEDLLERRGFNNISITNGGSNKGLNCSFQVASLSSSAAAPATNSCSWETERYGSPPVWLENLWKHGKGTGVFIPQVACRKNPRLGRRNNGTRRIYRQVVNHD